jgi:DNA-binding transcriptional LysR family regulator
VPIQRIDLNLFRVFEAIMQHRSVTAASRQLGVRPSAVSHALARLRHALADDLFVSGEAGMEPTPRALRLAPEIRDGLGRIGLAVGSGPFVPAEALLRPCRVASRSRSQRLSCSICRTSRWSSMWRRSGISAPISTPASDGSSASSTNL